MEKLLIIYKRADWEGEFTLEVLVVCPHLNDVEVFKGKHTVREALGVCPGERYNTKMLDMINFRI